MSSFMESIMDDLDEVFFDEDFMGSRHSFCEKEIVLIVDEEERERLNNKWKDEVNQCSVLLFVKESDMERRLSVGSFVDYDGEYYYVQSISKQDGVFKILLGENEV